MCTEEHIAIANEAMMCLKKMPTDIKHALMGGHAVTHEAILPKTQPGSPGLGFTLLTYSRQGDGLPDTSSCHQQNPDGGI